jgi:hypothetical protein
VEETGPSLSSSSSPSASSSDVCGQYSINGTGRG